MSGPKVVRVVTKQEIMARALRRIDAVQEAIERWRIFASSCNGLTDNDEKAIQKRFRNLLKMFEQERFQDVQRQSKIEIDSLQADLDRIREEAIAKAEHERCVRRRLQYSAETLIKTLEIAERPIPLDLLCIPSSAISATETDLVAMNSIMSRILTEYTLSIVENTKMTPLQKELSQKLTEGEKFQTLADWKSQYDRDLKAVESDSRLDKILAEIEAFESKETLQPFIDRVTLIAKETSSIHRSLLMDSLILDLVAHTHAQKEKEKILVSMQEIRCELRRLTSKPAKDLEASLTKAINSKDISSSKSLCDKGTSLVKDETRSLAGASRRKAILKGLTELGYEVKEDMLTAWAKNGRIVIKKPHEKGYGVELGAVEDVERVQIQLVSLEQSNGTSKAAQDLDRETIWCSEFSDLRTILENSGTTLHIEKALPVGSRPLKQVNNNQMNENVSSRSHSSNLKTQKN